MLLDKLKALFNRQMEKSTAFASVREEVQTVKKEVALATDTEDGDTDDEDALSFQREIESIKAKKKEERSAEEECILELLKLTELSTVRRLAELLNAFPLNEENQRKKYMALRENGEMEKMEQLKRDSEDMFKELKRQARKTLEKVNADWEQSNLLLGKKVIETLKSYANTPNEKIEVIKEITAYLETHHLTEKEEKTALQQEMENDEWDRER